MSRPSDNVTKLPPRLPLPEDRHGDSCIEVAAEIAVARGVPLRQFIDACLKWYRYYERDGHGFGR